MSIVQTQTTSFKKELYQAIHDLSTDTVKIALYTGNASLDASTTVYSSDNEVSATGYTAGGAVLTPTSLSSDNTNNTAFVSFNNVTWSPASFTTRGALIYNSTTNAAVFVLNFGSDKTPNSTFTVTFPTANSTNAIIRIT